jgi:hypothetical protein
MFNFIVKWAVHCHFLYQFFTFRLEYHEPRTAKNIRAHPQIRLDESNRFLVCNFFLDAIDLVWGYKLNFY